VTGQLTPTERRDGIVSLQADIEEQWETVGDAVWRSHDGVLFCEADEASGWLKTAREFDDFTFRLEFAISRDGNSGVFLRTDEGGRPAFRGMELQILDDHDADPSPKSTGAIYAAVSPETNTMKPAGEWNELSVRAVGPHLKARLNGVTIHDVDLGEHTEQLPTDPPTPLAERNRSGHIGLQSHGEPRPAYFRNIRVREHA